MVTEQMIRELAYGKWERAGYPEGNGVNFWLEAETELQLEYTPPKRKTVARPKATAAKVSPSAARNKSKATATKTNVSPSVARNK
jgi:hypothetical protein